MGPMLVCVVQIAIAAQATVTGGVRDAESGRPLASAAVELRDLARSASTDLAGRYELPDVPPGPQHVVVRKLGYAAKTLHAFVPRHGRLEIDVALEPEPLLLPPIEVRAPVSLRGFGPVDAAAFPDRALTLDAVRNHPLAAEPDGFQALDGGEVALRPETPSGVHVRGGATDQTAYLLDGVPIFNPYHAAGLFSAWNPDALASLRVSSAQPRFEDPAALAGTIEATTRAPGTAWSAQSSVSTTQARATLAGPLGAGGAGYVLGLRNGYPALLAPRREPSYVQGETGDQVAKLELPAFGGHARLLAYDAANELDAAAGPDSGAGSPGARNAYEWRSRSYGAQWRRAFDRATVRLAGWRASTGAASAWHSTGGGERLSSARRDWGFTVVAEHAPSGGDGAGAANQAALGIRLERSATHYLVASDSSGASPWRLDAVTPLASVFGRVARALLPRLEGSAGASLTAAVGALHPAPALSLRWTPRDAIAATASYARTHQFVQSLRNPESVVGNVFPADLFVGAGAPGVPVARGDLGVVGIELRPRSGVRWALQGYDRSARGLVLVAPREDDPFSSGAVAIGSSRARGVSLETAYRSTRFGAMASYGLERVHMAYGDSSYRPEHGATHTLQAGVIVFPAATAAVRLGASAAFGRRTTTAVGSLEWEAHNLLDQGSEFGGSPTYAGDPLGGTALPAYVRVDLGMRKHWHVHLRGRETTLELFGTATNLLGRRNVLTYVRDPANGRVSAIEMRPRAPLVVGFDWRL